MRSSETCDELIDMKRGGSVSVERIVVVLHTPTSWLQKKLDERRVETRLSEELAKNPIPWAIENGER